MHCASSCTNHKKVRNISSGTVQEDLNLDFLIIVLLFAELLVRQMATQCVAYILQLGIIPRIMCFFKLYLLVISSHSRMSQLFDLSPVRTI